MSSHGYSQQAIYYGTVHDESTLARVSQGKDTLSGLLGSEWTSAVSRWERKQLLAHRVVCHKPVAWLPIFDKPELGNMKKCIHELLKGPASIDQLKNSSEPQIMHRYQPDSLGYVWAALLPFVRKYNEPTLAVPRTPKHSRDRKLPDRLAAGVPSDQAYLGSSPDATGQRPTTSYSDSSFSSAGWQENIEMPLLEDATIRLASCFVRCVLNYGQPVEFDHGVFLEFRDERLTYSCDLGGSRAVHAVDDGGIQVFDKEKGVFRQVALLEGKRTFQKIVSGEALITDRLLAQMVGEVLALAMQDESDARKVGVSRTEFFALHATAHYLKFFHFHVSSAYKGSYGGIDENDPSDTLLKDVLTVKSTHWLDIKQSGHRKIIADHLLALISWTRQKLAE